MKSLAILAICFYIFDLWYQKELTGSEKKCQGMSFPGLKKGKCRVTRHFYDTLPLNPLEDIDHFIQKDGVKYAGNHILADFWGAKNLHNIEKMKYALKRAATESKATLLEVSLHHFGKDGGITGVAVLAESHISVHTWPEYEFAAFDIFTCGDSQPMKGIEFLKYAFKPKWTDIKEFKRGVIPEGFS